MKVKSKFIIVLLVLLFLNIAAISAADTNSTDIEPEDDASIETSPASNNVSQDVSSDDLNSNESDFEKTVPKLSVSSTKVYSKDTLEIHLENSSGKPLKSKKLLVEINNQKHSLKTDSKGTAKLKISLAAGSYKMSVSFEEDSEFKSVSKSFKIKVIKLKTKIVESGNFVVRGKYLYFHLIDAVGNPVSGKKVTVRFNGKTHTKKTNSNGRVGIKIKSPMKKYTIKVKFKGDVQYKSSSKKLKFYVTTSRSINIANTKLLTNGYLRVYIKIAGKAVSKKVILTVAGKKLSKKSNSEGIAVFKPKVKAYNYKVTAKVGKYYSSKNMKCIKGNVKDPLSESVALKNGRPDIDVMPGNYVWGDENGKYTLTKSQYREVLKRDSYCLFLNGKLTKYTFFKTKSHPKLNHIVKREKWNVIERAINAKLVKKNTNGYWPGSVTVSLKGKSYTYPYVRDVQNTGYTCGPASCSMCSQVLKNFVCEKYIAKLAKTNREGTKCSDMINAMAKNNFEGTYFYKSTFSEALNCLKEGGCALVFHANKHYVSILDISGDGKKVLVSNSYGSYDNIPTKWVKVSYMKNKFSPQWSESLIFKLNYKLSNSTQNSINSYYNSFAANWHRYNTAQSIGMI